MPPTSACASVTRAWPMAWRWPSTPCAAGCTMTRCPAITCATKTRCARCARASPRRFGKIPCATSLSTQITTAAASLSPSKKMSARRNKTRPIQPRRYRSSNSTMSSARPTSCIASKTSPTPPRRLPPCRACTCAMWGKAQRRHPSFWPKTLRCRAPITTWTRAASITPIITSPSTTSPGTSSAM